MEKDKKKKPQIEGEERQGQATAQMQGGQPQQQQPHQWLYRLSVSPLSSGNHKAFQCGQRHLLQRVDRTLGLNSYSLKRNGTASPLSCACPKSKIY